MSEERLEKIEGMLSQLISMVGKLNETQVLMQQDLQQLKQEQQEMKGKIAAFDENQQDLEKKNEERHYELMKRLKSMEIDQDFIWEKAVRNEREIEVLKRR